MAIIKQLDPHVADLIAAGEVVERPLSVVKELVENGLDAGARAITVEIQSGGLTYIRVTDDGAGMAEEDAKIAFRRHATSKLHTGRDLEAVSTLGFRGEALAAISAVSRIDLLTRQAKASEGTSVTVEAGQVRAVSPVGCPVGTTMIVRDLFFNTPARLKFMKSDRAEAAAITAMLTGMTLSHPEVSFRYIRDGKEEYHTPGDGSVQSAIYTLLGREFAKGLIEVKGQDADVKVAGFVTAPANARGNRSHQHFYVNGRYVRSKLLQAALEQAYKNVQFTGKFPGCVLYLTVGYGAVDVNVHPTKTEIKFLHEKQAFDAVYYSVLEALEKSSYMPEIDLSRGTQRALEMSETSKTEENPAGGRSAGPSARKEGQKGAILGQLRGESVQKGTGGRVPPPRVPSASAPMTGELRDTAAVVYQSRFDLPAAESISAASSVEVPAVPPVGCDVPMAPSPESTEESRQVMEDQVEVPPYRIVGEALETYILVERGGELLFIDKHAAHERILFDQLRCGAYTPMAQTLLAPLTVDLGPEVTAILLEHGEALETFGFEIDQFGMGTVALRQVPELIDLDDMEAFLGELAEGLRLGKAPDMDGVRDEVIHTMACKAAIKAGRRSDPAELRALAERVLCGDILYCPHGRPVSLVLTRAQLDKQVRRS